MHFKRILAAALTAALVLSCAACGNRTAPETASEATTLYTPEESTAPAVTEIATAPEDTTVEATSAELNETVAETTAAQPTEISKAEIVATYKAAAEKSHKNARTYRAISLVDFSINNGQYANVIDFVMPIIGKLLSNNSKEVDGITGGFQNLTEADVKTAKTYTVDDKTVIEFTLHEQRGGPRDSEFSGSVGHAITAVGDIGYVTDQITDLGIPLEISDEHTYIDYTNPTVKVVIDSNGKIVNGTWSYTVAINLNQYKVGNKTVESTKIVMNNVLTVNGGFKK
ncbi:MAG: hypothetical protein IJA87_11395 [Clostridia bacterium]|nr:hypothetical protein [Clostridia bacterium]